MAKNSGSRAVPENIPDLGVPQQGSRPSPIQASGAGRLTLPQVLPLIVFPMIGGVLSAMGMPVSDTFTLLAGCGGIGVAVTIAVTGGRRVLVALAHGVLAAASNR
ncbi:hypothetical protein ABZ609_30725 [Streptomyces rubiginosohelvolus]|uniref:hypothetical protein n=1 Tax=Streptomyces rubiginosohelvolus TaxID=67362 RepID=UPI00340BFCFA